MSGFNLIIPFDWPPLFQFFMSRDTGFRLRSHGYFFCAWSCRTWFLAKPSGDVVFLPLRQRRPGSGRRQEYYARHPVMFMVARSKRMRHSAGFGGGNGAGKPMIQWRVWLQPRWRCTALLMLKNRVLSALRASGCWRWLLRAARTRLSFCPAFTSTAAVCLPAPSRNGFANMVLKGCYMA